MSVQVRLRDPDGCGSALDVALTRGDRLSFTMWADGRKSAASAARAAAWRGATWLCQVRRTPDDDEVVATLEATETVDETPDGDVVTVTFVADEDTSAWAGSYSFDVEIASGPLAPYTYFPGSKVWVQADTSRAVGS